MPRDQRIELIRKLRRVYIQSRWTDRVFQKLDQLTDHSLAGCEEGITERSFLLTGPPGSGKSRLLRRWASQFKPVEYPDRTTLPVLYVNIPPKATLKGLLEHSLRALGAIGGRGTSGSDSALESRMLHYMREREVKIAIFDELHHLGGHSQFQSAVPPSYFKFILNENICPVALSGTAPLARDLFDSCEELSRRAIGRMTLEAHDWNKAEERATFRALLQEFEKHLPLPEKSNLSDMRTALRLHVISDGLFGKAVEHIINATEMALYNGAASLTWDLLADMFEGFNEDRPDWFNVFKVEADDQLAGFNVHKDRSRRTRLHKKKAAITVTEPVAF